MVLDQEEEERVKGAREGAKELEKEQKEPLVEKEQIEDDYQKKGEIGEADVLENKGVGRVGVAPVSC